ncbi:class II glutamine amidotransferase [Jannaschia seohaensis]|uniref:Glutamine amidotransferase n=1 Tax=Jannaschia seohaensis TaxID=475081 RepID=A0A2Y9B6A6_9RHOB|nr:class II glutamine amidotransferase [Jannaschia seohaensis]PWJ09932.1 glutamine amidotransferase [Jannaschia seohaensis]SSA51911.1 glutamine amidotransferase [Jannaschia seohaensis]
MCRLYAMRANEPTRVECGLVRSQNALMAQSKGDMGGLMHGHGWGVADYPDGVPIIEKQTWAAFEGEHFTKAAARVYAHTAVAHVRRATVGPVSVENTHPFSHGRWIFAHNGTLPGFEDVRFQLLEHMDPLHRSEIRGQTDSEHIFRYLLSLFLRHPEVGLLETVRRGLEQIVTWCAETAPDGTVGLNIVLTDGETLIGSRLNRTLYHLRRDHLHVCNYCGKTHVHHDPKQPYRAIEVASEPITPDEPWTELPNSVVYAVSHDIEMEIEPLAAGR